MTPVKTATIRGARVSRRMAKKVTLDDVWTIIHEMAQTNQEIQATHKETEAAQKENQQIISRLSNGMEEIRVAQKESQRIVDGLSNGMKESQRIVDGLSNGMKESQRIVDGLGNGMEEIRVANKEIQAALKESQRIVGDLGNKFGDEAEHTLVPGLLEKFKQLDFNFGVLNPNRKVRDKEHNIHIEVDAFLENGTQTMAVEVKARLKKSDVDTHIKRMENLRRYADLHGDRRNLFGAMAATVVSDNERDYALEKGFYVIEPSGEDVKITKPDIEWHL